MSNIFDMLKILDYALFLKLQGDLMMQVEDNRRVVNFREKMAWIMVAGLVTASGFYFYTMFNVSAAMEQVPKPAVIALTVVFVVILTFIAIIGAIVAALSNLSEANDLLDERDKLISLHSTRWASVVTSIILIITMLAYFFGARSSDMLLGVMSALIMGHLVDYTAQIYLYRRRPYSG